MPPLQPEGKATPVLLTIGNPAKERAAVCGSCGNVRRRALVWIDLLGSGNSRKVISEKFRGKIQTARFAVGPFGKPLFVGAHSKDIPGVLKMQSSSIKCLGYVLLLVCASGGQEKPKINLQPLPSEPIPVGACTASWFGYLEKDSRTDLTDAEIGEFVSKNLRDGYVITIYPKTKRGIFASLSCPTASKPNAHP
jgi:hypothetical protein